MAELPVLCFDTCALFDLMRDPTRKEARVQDRQAGLDLLAAAERADMRCFIPEQVGIEFAERDEQIQKETEARIRALRDQLDNLNAIDAVYGTGRHIDLSHLDDHIVRARAIVERWIVKAERACPSALAPAKAFVRMNAGIAPGRRDKDSSKDCLIFETILELGASLRASGNTAQIVFLSSNSAEYVTESRKLKPEIAAEFSPSSLTYAPNMSAAKYALGL